MRSVFFIFLILFYSLSLYAQGRWTLVGPGAGSDLKSIAIHPENPDVVYIGGDIEGIFKTTDGGSTWKNINNNLATEYSDPGVYYVQEIKFDPGDPTYNTIFICTTLGLFKSINGGNSWSLLFPKEVTSEEDFVTISYIEIDPSNSSKLWIGTGIQYEDTEGNGSIYFSDDGGDTWNEKNIFSGDQAIHGIYVDPLSPEDNRTIYVSSGNGFYKSTNNGSSWTVTSNGLPHNRLRRLKGFTKNNSTTLFLSLTTLFTEGDSQSFKGGLFKSTNGGDSWIDITGNLPKYQEDESQFYFYWKFTFNPEDPDIIYTGTTRGWPDEGYSGWEEWGIYKSTNGGQTWEYTSDQIERGWQDEVFNEDIDVFVLDLAPSNPDIVYWGLDWMHKSTDAGNTWHQIYSIENNGYWQTTGLGLMVSDDMAFDPTDHNRVYISYDDFGPFRSDDGGQSFKPLDPTQDPYDGYDAAKEIIVDPDNGDVYLSRYEGLAGAYESDFALGQVWKSTDYGETWEKISTGLPDGHPKLIMDKNSGAPGNRVLYCAIWGSGIYKSTNSGSSWTQINSGLGDNGWAAWEIEIDPNDSQVLYAGTNVFGTGGELFKSTNAGNSWQKINSFPSYDILNIEFDNSSSVFVSGTDNFDYNYEGGLYKSTDNGNSWTEILDDTRIIDIEIDPADNKKIYAASQGWYIWNEELKPGIYYTEDGGNSWTNITSDLGNTFIMYIKLNPFDPTKLFAGTNGGGVWMFDNSATSVSAEINAVDNFKLFQNYPNPFNPTTTIKYTVPSVMRSNTSPYKTQLIVYDVLGQKVATLVNDIKSPDTYEIEFDASFLPVGKAGLSSGIYFYSLQAGGSVLTRKMILIK